MKLLSHLLLLLVTILIFAVAILMMISEGGWSLYLVGSLTAGYALVNVFILLFSWRAKDCNRRGLGVASAIVNGIFFLTWLFSSLDHGGLQQLEGPVMILLAFLGITNWLTVGPKLYLRKKYNV